MLEADALPRVLARTPATEFATPTICTGWSVRDVIAHCAAALRILIDGSMTAASFTPEANQLEVDARAALPIQDVIEELVDSYGAAAVLIDAAGGALDGIALGEWIHGGDIRDAIGAPDAYASAGIELALPLLGERAAQRGAPALDVSVDGLSVPFGAGTHRGRLVTDAATFVRLVGGRRPDPARYALENVAASELILFS
jgi:uncharacterized protein (TIGR03083 family)